MSEVYKRAVKHRNNRTASCRLTGKFSAVCALVGQWKRRRIHRQRHSAMEDSKSERSLQEGVKHRTTEQQVADSQANFQLCVPSYVSGNDGVSIGNVTRLCGIQRGSEVCKRAVKHRNNRTASCRLTGKFSAVCALVRQSKRRRIHRQRHSALRDSKSERSLQEGSETQKQQNSKLQTHRQIFSCVCPRRSVETAVYP